MSLRGIQDGPQLNMHFIRHNARMCRSKTEISETHVEGDKFGFKIVLVTPFKRDYYVEKYMARYDGKCNVVEIMG